MIIEEQRFLHEDIERLEQAIADRILDEPTTERDRLRKDHTLAYYLDRIETLSKRLIRLYEDKDGSCSREMEALATGDNFDSFYSQIGEIKNFHRRYPNEQVDRLDIAYRKPGPGDPGPADPVNVTKLFSGEEAFGRFFDLNLLHERYLNLPAVKGGRKVSYLQYLSLFDQLDSSHCPIKRRDKTQEAYRSYVTDLSTYLESFIRRARPLEDFDSVFSGWDGEFEAAWTKDEIPSWSSADQSSSTEADGDQKMASPLWCAVCERDFSNQNLFDHHLPGKKHKRAATAAAESTTPRSLSTTAQPVDDAKLEAARRAARDQERSIAEVEFRVAKLARAMQLVRDDTKVNVERKQALTDRERTQELAALDEELTAARVQAGGRLGLSRPTGGWDGQLSSMGAGSASNLLGPDGASGFGGGEPGGGEDSDDEERIYNPLKLPLAWDGKPIPYWLYKLHGLGVEFPCEICGNFVYMGRRAFDKHFNEARHIYGLKCLGITDTALFREVIRIEDALKLQEKIQRNKKASRTGDDNVVQMEDADGNVMPEKVYYDLQKQGLL